LDFEKVGLNDLKLRPIVTKFGTSVEGGKTQFSGVQIFDISPKIFYAILNFSLPLRPMGPKISKRRQTSGDRPIRMKFGPHMKGINRRRL